jgi:Pvc16 N-terminal domain
LSNSYAIAAVTATLFYLFRKEGITVSIKSPDKQSPIDNRLNIFLYQVSPNLGYRNMDLPARNYEGELVNNQLLSLNLNYLITAYGAGDEELPAQQILANAMRILYENPNLKRETIVSAINDNDVKAIFSAITGSDLAEQIELIKVTMQNLSLEDLTKIWSSFFKTGSYHTSVAYQATVVLLNGKQEQTRSALPVKDRIIYVIPPSRPEIKRIEPQKIVGWSATGMEISLIGQNLKAEDVRIDFGEGLPLEDLPRPNSMTDNKIVVEIPNRFTLGTKQVRVIHPLSMGSPGSPHKGYVSNMTTFMISPSITNVDPKTVKQGQQLTLNFEPAVTYKQKVNVLIGTLLLPVPTREEGLPPITNVSVIIPDDLPAKTYSIRLQVNGIESLLKPDDNPDNPLKLKPAIKVEPKESPP